MSQYKARLPSFATLARCLGLSALACMAQAADAGAGSSAAPSSDLSYPPCRVDASYVAVAKATGGAVFCRPASGAAVDDAVFKLGISGFAITSSRFEFKAGWKVLGHGSMDRYTYAWGNLPSGPVTLQIVNFPVKLASVETLVAFNESGEVSAPAVLLTRIGGGVNEIALETWRFNALRGNFRIALHGKTTSGTPFVIQAQPELLELMTAVHQHALSYDKLHLAILQAREADKKTVSVAASPRP